MSTDQSTLHFDAICGDAMTLQLPGAAYTSKEFWELCVANPDIAFELNADGRITIMTPTGGSSGRRGIRIGQLLMNWCDHNGMGIGFDSSTLFQFPNKSVKSPDASWILLERWNALTEKEQDGIVPIVPDFVAELRSPTDSLRRLREKMTEYIEQGVRLGWLIDPKTRSVEIYRPGKDVERIENAERVSGDPELPGFVMDLGKVW
jgi:Uma2 family endonuclease